MNNELGIYISDSFLNSKINRTKRISIKNINFLLHTPTYLTNYRYKTFFSKEPETIEWIDNFEKKSVFYDIGANVGLYSIYASINKNSKVFSFEPSFFNLELLARNIFSNNMNKEIVIIPLPLNDKISISNFELTSTDWGGALSSFEKSINDSGKKIDSIFSYNTLGFDLDAIVKISSIPKPDYIKIDVDGLEHFILSGGEKTIKKAKEILLEVNDNFSLQRDQTKLFLNKAGFFLEKKVFASDKSSVANQIWKKKK
tara:strand:+ start:1938 stop:2708 length:771 start_codon:yes stop_codon:yes gene_type:complete